MKPERRSSHSGGDPSVANVQALGASESASTPFLTSIKGPSTSSRICGREPASDTLRLCRYLRADAPLRILAAQPHIGRASRMHAHINKSRSRGMDEAQRST